MHYVGISTYQFNAHYASAIHTRILKTSEDSELTGLKVDTDHQLLLETPADSDVTVERLMT